MYKDYETLTKQAAAAARRGEFEYAKELLKGREFPVPLMGRPDNALKRLDAR